VRYFYSKNTPLSQLNVLKYIILSTVALSLFSALFDALFPYWHLPKPQVLFSLSLWGVKHYFIWQFLTHFFIAPMTGGVSISFILYLVFNMYFLWMVGSSVIERQGVKHFLFTYLGGGIFSGIIAIIVLFNTHSFMPIAGINPALYALLTAWMMLLPEVQILLFFAIPIKIKWLIVGILGINLFMDLSQGNLIHFALYLSSIGFGYFYALLAWQIHSPFKVFHAFEKVFINMGDKLKRSYSYSQNPSYSKGKIYDFKTGKVLFRDEEFMDSCLSKIATQGKDSLTFLERWKMKRISKKKKRSSKST
jgi:membrane associated rhomboid family serine protease